MKNKLHIYRHNITKTALIVLLTFTAIEIHCEPDDFRSSKIGWQKGYVEGALEHNPNLEVKRLSVRVAGGKAEIHGFVRSSLGRALAEQIVLSVKGIDSVFNHVKIKPELFDSPHAHQGQQKQKNSLANVTISNKVKSQLLANPLTNGLDVDIQTRDRQVTLSGVVNSDHERALTYWVVKNTSGVESVEDQLTIQDVDKNRRE